MPSGKLQVLLVSAKGLHDTDFFRQGSSPEWNETFVFSLTGDEEQELVIKIKDSDVGSEDDTVGEAKIPLEPLFLAGSIPPTPYNVVINDQFCGEVKVGLEFIPEETHEYGHRHGHGHGHGHHEEERSYGGWKESSY
ncbi:16 kDa phloem protein 2-like isoform X2 [Bidens hawaiensis]|uniref:16 kDa phloem protein 2-like isoform X2 n=1 Tax=Bidens hawaiensis TaxID=980011 RepID=UPI0040498165